MKIMVVDDEPIIADTLVDILNGEGHNALSFSQGESAIRLAEIMQPDLLVTDVVMPGIDGIETAKAMLKVVPNCRIILFSGQAESTDMISKARADGHFFEVLAKPVNPCLL
jgi:CheY-like chemotaxis protein